MKSFKFNSNQNPIFFTSDLHLGHDKEFIWGKRGFKSVQEHKEFLFRQLKHLPKNSILFNLGDATFKDPKMETFTELAKIELEEHYLLNGNHRSGHNQAYSRVLSDFNGCNIDSNLEIYPLKFENITFIGDYWEIFIDKTPVTLCHYPIPIFNGLSQGGIMCCGHSHNGYPETNTDNKTNRFIDVGVESNLIRNGSPFISWESLKEIMDGRPKVQFDHH